MFLGHPVFLNSTGTDARHKGNRPRTVPEPFPAAYCVRLRRGASSTSQREGVVDIRTVLADKQKTKKTLADAWRTTDQSPFAYRFEQVS